MTDIFVIGSVILDISTSPSSNVLTQQSALDARLVVLQMARNGYTVMIAGQTGSSTPAWVERIIMARVP